MRQTKLFAAILFVILGLGANLPDVYAQEHPNTITFDNQSGEPAHVKLIGPTGKIVEVPNGQSRTVNVSAGEYYILARYGSKPDLYKFSKGDPFTVTQTATQYSVITITLHKVIGGNYPTRPTSSEEFEKTPVVVHKTDRPEGIKTLTPVLPTPKTQQPLPKIQLPKTSPPLKRVQARRRRRNKLLFDYR